ncbi:MAG TPA: SapC family protein [Cellvibrio sp.]|nr:SapC family protein [Cellvibrio sp.]
MGKNVLLDNVTHKGLKIITGQRSGYGYELGHAVIVPREFRQVAANYPIVFRKISASNQFEAVALFGFNAQENLYLNDNGWQADYIPLSVERIPFMIGHATDPMTGEQQPVIHIDMENPRVSFCEGVDVFLEHGGKAPYLEHINSILAELMNGLGVSKRFVDILLAEDLLEPFTLKFPLKDNSAIELSGYYTIKEETLRSLNGDQLARLHNQNFLELIYMVIASLANLGKLIKKKQQRHGQ